MANMSYCMFENTYGDLKECAERLSGINNLENLIGEMNEYDKKYVKKLIKLCGQIYQDWEDEVE